MAGALTVQSDYEVRAYSVSQGRPVGILDLSYDDPSGFYLSDSTFGALPDHDNPGLLGLVGAAGYAHRLNTLLSVDGGVTREEYIGIGSGGYQAGYTELYAGLSTRNLSAHLAYSPDYFHTGIKTLYSDLEGNLGTVADIRLNAHIGMLNYIDRPGARTQYDWRVGASRQFGVINVHAALSGGGPNPDFYDGDAHSRTEFIVGAGYTF